ncbi:hypothetical protein RZE82_08015 [Mollicutes bacterium LVI A0039]|nr:hypothetical protein RZE82_08015 [Mollicutes bacterium LVI A0039]
MTLVKIYPPFTDLGIEPYTDSKLRSSYLYYGYVKNLRGLFRGYEPNPGAITRLMDSNFNVLSANVVLSDYSTTMDTHGYGGLGVIAYGNVGEERNFGDLNNTVSGNKCDNILYI